MNDKSHLILLGALVAKAGVFCDEKEELYRLAEKAKEEIDDALDKKQYALWESIGGPTFLVDGE